MESDQQQIKIHLSKLRPSPNNPRGTLQRIDWDWLNPSVEEHGVIQPILVRPIEGEDVYEIVAGECRYRSANDVFQGAYDMPCLVRELTDEAAFLLAAIENFQRQKMNPAKEAEACQTILNSVSGDKAEAARLMGWDSVATLERRLALMACTQKVRDALVAKKIDLGHAELLAAVPPETQDKTLERVIAQNIPVKTLRENLGKFARRLCDAPFDKTECATCRHNSNVQSQLFSEALGDGYCTHPTHYDELADKFIAGIADGYKDSYPVVRVYKPTDGFVPLQVAPQGNLGVGEEQYQACKGCGSFGCSVSAMPGSYGAVSESLCFDAACNSKKIAAHRKAQRAASATPAGTTTSTAAATKPTAEGKAEAPKQEAANKPSPRVLEYRVIQWRKWAANQLMLNPVRNQRVITAVLLSGNQSRLAGNEFRDAVAKIAGMNVGHNLFDGALKDAEQIDVTRLPQIVQCVSASAAFGIDESNLEILLNYLEIDEAAHFKLNAEFLDLFTKSELDLLADELKLKKAMGKEFAKAKDGKKEAFVKALLAIPDFGYAGLVPKVMRYRRRKLALARKAEPAPAAAQTLETTPA